MIVSALSTAERSCQSTFCFRRSNCKRCGRQESSAGIPGQPQKCIGPEAIPDSQKHNCECDRGIGGRRGACGRQDARGARARTKSCPSTPWVTPVRSSGMGICGSAAAGCAAAAAAAAAKMVGQAVWAAAWGSPAPPPPPPGATMTCPNGCPMALRSIVRTRPLPRLRQRWLRRFLHDQRRPRARLSLPGTLWNSKSYNRRRRCSATGISPEAAKIEQLLLRQFTGQQIYNSHANPIAWHHLRASERRKSPGGCCSQAAVNAPRRFRGFADHTRLAKARGGTV